MKRLMLLLSHCADSLDQALRTLRCMQHEVSAILGEYGRYSPMMAMRQGGCKAHA